jgi:hypothetical protein
MSGADELFTSTSLLHPQRIDFQKLPIVLMKMLRRDQQRHSQCFNYNLFLYDQSGQEASGMLQKKSFPFQTSAAAYTQQKALGLASRIVGSPSLNLCSFFA